MSVFNQATLVSLSKSLLITVELTTRGFRVLFTQVCSIEMMVDDLDMKTVLLVPSNLRMEQFVDMTLYVIKNWTLDYRNTSNHQNGVRMTLLLKRKIMNEMMTTYLPSVLLILITYSTTWFKPYFFEAALSVNLTTMLVMTTIFMTVMQMLPATAYVKMIDLFLIFGQLYPFAEVVLLTAMEYQREGDGSGIMEDHPDSEEETPEILETSMNRPEDKLYWYRVTGKFRSNMLLFDLHSFQRRKYYLELLLPFSSDILLFPCSSILVMTRLHLDGRQGGTFPTTPAQSVFYVLFPMLHIVYITSTLLDH